MVVYLNYQIPVTQLKGPKEVGEMLAAKRDCNAPPTRDLSLTKQTCAEQESLESACLMPVLQLL